LDDVVADSQKGDQTTVARLLGMIARLRSIAFEFEGVSCHHIPPIWVMANVDADNVIALIPATTRVPVIGAGGCVDRSVRLAW
jgi:hypothetical protein